MNSPRSRWKRVRRRRRVDERGVALILVLGAITVLTVFLTQLQEETSSELAAALSERDALKLLTEGMAADWSLEGLTTLLYGVPKLQRGLPISAPPTAELRASQRTWFILLYQLLIGKDTGPRLPTLLLALGQDQIRHLLTPG